VDVLAWGDDSVELVEGGGEGNCVVAGDDLGEDLPGAHVRGRDQGRGTVAAVLELLPGGMPWGGGPAGVAPGSGGDRGLLVNG
jgi:hypothetical protein